MLQFIKYERFNFSLYFFDFEQFIYVVFDHIFIIFIQMIECSAYSNAMQLTVILRQINRLEKINKQRNDHNKY